MLIGSQGSSRMETTFVPRGEEVDIQPCIKLFHVRCCSPAIPGKQEGKKQTPLILVELQPIAQHAPGSTCVVFYHPQEGILPIVPPRACGFPDLQPQLEQESASQLHELSSTVPFVSYPGKNYQEKLYSHTGKEDKCPQPFHDTTALLSFHEMTWFLGFLNNVFLQASDPREESVCSG